MAHEKCGCGGGEKNESGCHSCSMDAIFTYFCPTCNRSVPDKRCPYCGLKTQRKKES